MSDHLNGPKDMTDWERTWESLKIAMNDLGKDVGQLEGIFESMKKRLYPVCLPNTLTDQGEGCIKQKCCSDKIKEVNAPITEEVLTAITIIREVQSRVNGVKDSIMETQSELVI